MKNKKFYRAVVGFVSLSFVLFTIYVVDFAILYSIFLYFQFLLAPFLTGIGYLFYVVRLSIPYICMYILICIFFNIQTYKTNSTIKLLKYTIDLNVVRRSKLYIYLREYNYVLIIAFNLFLLFIVYYAYVNNKYFYLLFVFLFYLFIWIIIKVKHWLLKNETLQYKKIHMLVNVILVVLIGTYISMALEDFHVSNSKLYGFENFWKLIDNKYFLKMPSKDFNWNRLFNWSKQVSTDRYMYDFKKGIIKSQFLDKTKPVLFNSEEYDSLSCQNIKNDDMNLNMNTNLWDYLNRTHYKDQNLSRFSNALYQKFKKVFLLQLQIKSSNFKPTPEINERHKLLNWLKNPRNFIDLAEWYTPAKSMDSSLYDNYLDLFDKKFNNLTTKKVFLITLNKNYFSLKSFAFYADFEESFKKNYMIFLNSEKDNMDFKDNTMLNFEYYNSYLYTNFEFNNLWVNFKNDLYIIFKENEQALSLFKMKFKSLYTLKKFTFSFKNDVLDDTDNEILLELKPRKRNFIMIPDFKKLQIWKTFKSNYKEIIFSRTIAKKHIKFVNYENKWLYDNKLKIPKQPLNELYFIVDEDEAYVLYDNQFYPVEDLEFDFSTEQYDVLSEYISYYLENIKTRSKAIKFASTRQFKKIFINDLDKTILEFQNKKHHVPTFYSMYHEILLQNSNNFFKYIIENSILSRDLLTSSRSLMTFNMWSNVMHKLLNLNTESFCLNNLKDYSDFCKSDFTEDLQFNFSLAFDIMQNKYDLNNLFLIPDLEGIPGTFYEYTVKYNAHMARYYWYEEQEALIDWIYEISYYSLVNIMDTVKEVNYKENDFLYAMINEYLRHPHYKWAANLFEEKYIELEEPPLQPTELLNELNNKLDLLDELKILYQRKHLMQLLTHSDKSYIESIENRSLLDFNDIKSVKQFNIKVKRDLLIIDYLYYLHDHYITSLDSEIAEDFEELNHIDYHNSHFKYLEIMNWKELKSLNKDLGKLGGVGYFLNDYYNIKYELYEFGGREFFDDLLELENMEKIDSLMDEFEDKMYFEYDHLIEMEELEEWLDDEFEELFDRYMYLIENYQEVVETARTRLIGEINNFNKDKQDMILSNDDELMDFDIIKLEVEKLRLIELQNIYLDELTIFDWSTHTYIQENIDLLNEHNVDLLEKKFKELDVLLEKEKKKFAEMDKVRKLYNERVIKHAMEEPGTKRYLEKNWDDYNYLSNKTDKLMRDWFKAGKKK